MTRPIAHSFCVLLAASVQLAFCASTLSADETAEFSSPADIWRGYDPEALPLEIESISAWSEDGAHFEKLRFTAEQAAGAKVRVFAIRGAPAEGDRLPGILHIHGGGQTASLDWVRFWTRRGYACVTFDFCGPWADRREVTDWGPIKHANMADAHGGYQVSPSPRASSWYHWTLASRRALSLLAEEPRVDRANLGIFGISVGGTLTWMVAGSDQRVKTAVPIYGCGYNLDRRKARFGFGELTPEQALFQRTLSSEAHAPYIRCPLLFLDATNDFHGWLNTAFDTLEATPAPHWQAFTPRYNHHIAPDQATDLPAWMDAQLRGGSAFPTSPQLELVLADDGICRARTRTAGSPVRRIDVFYSLGDKPSPNRFWRQAAPSGDGSPPALPLVDAWDELWAFANVHYESGVCLSTNLVRRVPAQMGKARASLKVGESLDRRAVALSWYYATAHTDPVAPQHFLIVEEDDQHGPTVRVNPQLFGETIILNLATHVVGDPQYTGPAGARLAIDCAGKVDDAGLSVSVTQYDWTPRAQTFVAKVERDEISSAWHSVVLPLARFRTADGKPLESWQALDKLQLQAKSPRGEPLRIANLRFVSQGD